MDNEQKAKLLKELLSDPETISILKEVLLETSDKKDNTTKKRGRKPKTKEKVEKTQENEFVDNLEEASEFIAIDKLIQKPRTKQIQREKKFVKKNCTNCQKEFDSFGGYLCSTCIGGR